MAGGLGAGGCGSMGCGSTSPAGSLVVAPAEGVPIIPLKRDDRLIELVRAAPQADLPPWLFPPSRNPVLELHP